MQVQNDTDQDVGYTIDVGDPMPAAATRHSGPSRTVEGGGLLSPEGTPGASATVPVAGEVQVVFLVASAGAVRSPWVNDSMRVTLVQTSTGSYSTTVSHI